MPAAVADRAQTVLEQIEDAYVARFTQFARVATAIAGDPERGRDAVQEAFARAIAGRLDYRGDGPVEAWLWRAVTNLARNQRRAAGPMVPVDPSDERLGGSPAEPADERAAAVRRHVAALPERQRLVLFLRYYADLSYTQIGAALGLRTGTVSATLAAAHRTLRARLE